MNDGLDRLSESERAALRLLAGGHSVKSAAAVLGLSENAVNERLREARRKTGRGSSREVARLLAAQENRDREIGGAGDGLRSDGDGDVPAMARRSILRQGKLPMTILIATLLAVVLQPHGADAPVDDPLLAPHLNVEAQVDGRAMYHRLRSETRDAAWADATEAALLSAVDTLPDDGTRPLTVRVTCGATLCEVAGELDGRSDRASRAMVGLQTMLGAQARRRGMIERLFGATFPQGEPRRGVFVSYLERR